MDLQTMLHDLRCMVLLNMEYPLNGLIVTNLRDAWMRLPDAQYQRLKTLYHEVKCV